MIMLYGKQVLKTDNINIFGKNYKAVVIDDDEYLSLHILCDDFKQEELNTLAVQCEKGEDCLSELNIYLAVTEFALWHRFYGYKNKMHQFRIKHEEHDMLDF